MEGYFGFPGQVLARGQVRIQAPYKGGRDITGVQIPLSGLGSIHQLPSGAYRGAPGARVRTGAMQQRQRDQDMALFYSMGMPLTGPAGLMASGGVGSVTDRQACQASFAVGSGLYNAATGAIVASQAGANMTAQQTAAQQQLAAQLQAGGTGINALSNLCNLANDGNPPVNSFNPSAALAQAQLAQIQQAAMAQQLYAMQGQQQGTFTTPTGQLTSTGKLAVGAGILAVAGIGAYFLLKK